MPESLGVDLGNVIIDHVGFGTTPEFFRTGDYNIIPPVSGVFDVIKRLNQERFHGNIFVVYNATDVADEKIVSWMKVNQFFTRTGVSSDRVQRTRQGRDKSSLCELYRATHFIDDRLQVLGHLIGKVQNLYLFKPQDNEVRQHCQFLPHVQKVSSWNEVAQRLLT